MVAFATNHEPGTAAVEPKNRVGDFFVDVPGRAGWTGSATRTVAGENGRFDYDACRSVSLAQGGEGERGLLGRAWESIAGAGKWVYNKATGWHFEGRSALNGPHPTYGDVTSPNSDWIQLPSEQSIHHDNGVGNPELKFIHPSGREAVFS